MQPNLHVQDDNQLLAALAQGDPQALQALYSQHRSSFIAWAIKQFRCETEDAADLYQDAVIILYENAIQGKVVGSGKLSTYLFGIGRNLILKQVSKYQKFTDADALPEHEGNLAEGWVDAPLELNERQVLLQGALASLGEACRRLLVRFYYDRYSTEAIMAEFGYKSSDVVKSQKARCMRGLRKMLGDKAELFHKS